MLTVTISINTKPIIARSAVNIGDNDDGTCSYRLDTGKIIKHKQSEGASKLAIKMLKTVDARFEDGK